ncbi:hypothetical protein MRS44_012240 [Fusarium solani]|uniref:uncharacterized protein n=1 Tax=Fusarium solani TaxID=169388 RepID=UPI0032C49385|nr:hypothetical protein MRS44_012240 [Fusarium solani]
MSATHVGRGDMFHNAGTQNICKDSGTQIIQTGPDDEATQDRRCSKYLEQNGYDPADQKANAERQGGQLFEGACQWIYDNAEFQQWANGTDPPSLWLHGGPGKGKSMLLCSVINHLLKWAEGAPDGSHPSCLVAYSFFSDPDGVYEASFVVASLVYGLVKQQPSYLRRVSKVYDHENKYPFQGRRSFTALEKILEDMLRDATGNRVILVVDALDECKTDLDRLLDLILRTSSIQNVRWLVSSRGLRTIHQKFDATESKMRKLSLDQTGADIQKAVQVYTRHQMWRLHHLRMSEEEREELENRLLRKAGGTFLWLSIVMAELGNVASWDIDDVVDGLPDDLESLYVNLLQSLLEGVEQKKNKNLVKDVLYKTLVTTAAALRPLYIEELKELAEFPAKIRDNSQVEEVIDKCGAFLTCQNNQVFLIHLSAKEFLTPEKLQSAFQSNHVDIHSHLFSRSMSVMEENLKRDIYNLKKPEIPIWEIDLTRSPDPLSGLKYSCVHWIDHLEQVQFQNRSHYQAVRLFIENSLLRWLEAMSLQKKIEEAINAVEKLRSLMTCSLTFDQQNTKDYELDTLTDDTARFVEVHRETIRIHPLQIYISALLFSPTGSCVRRFYRGEEPDWISLKSKRETTWSPRAERLFTLAPPSMLDISTDGNLLASIFRPDWQDEEWEELYDELEWEWGADYPHSQHPSSLLEIWDLNSHEPISRLGLDFNVLAIGFLRDGKRLALAGNPNRFEIWNAETGSRLQTLQSLDEPSVCFTSLALSTSAHLDPNEDVIASGLDNGAVRFWNPATGDCTRSIHTSGERVGALTFSQDGQKLAVGLENGTVEVWDFRSGTLVWKLKGDGDTIASMTFLGDDQLVSTSEGDEISIWDLQTGGCIRNLYMWTVGLVVSLGSGGLFASATRDEPMVRIWNNKGDSIQLFEGNEEGSNVLAFCPEQQLLAHATFYGVDIWDLKLFPFIKHIPLHIEQVLSTTLSSDSLLLASGSEDSIKIWNTTNGTCIRSIDCDLVGVLAELTIWNADDGQAVKTFPKVRGWEAFSPDGRLLALALSSIVTVWDMDASKQHHQIQCSATCLVFSADGNKLALASDTKLEIWDMSNGKRIWTVGHQRTRVRSITLSADTRLLAAASQRGIDVWDVSAGELRVPIFAGQSLHHTVYAVAFSPNRELLAWISDGEIGMRNLKDGRETRFSLDGGKRRFSSYEWLSSGPGLSGRATIQFKGPDCSRLCTSIGDLDINADGAITGFHGYHLDEDHKWIMRGEERMVLLPKEYRGGPASILSGQRIAVSGWNGGILFFQLV